MRSIPHARCIVHTARVAPPVPSGTPAVLASLRAVSTNSIRATFTNPVRHIDPVGYTDATNPDNWTVTRTLGGYAPQVVRCEAVVGDTKSVILWLLTRFEDGVEYSIVAAANVREL